MTSPEGDRLALWSGTGVLIACMACGGIPTCCLWTVADVMSKDSIGPSFWIVGGLVGMGIGIASGLLGCLLATRRAMRELLIDEPAELVGAKVVDEGRAVRALRYLIGVPLALLGAGIGFFWFLDTVHKAMRGG